MIQHHVYSRSTDQFKQVGVHEKNERNEINIVDDQARGSILGQNGVFIELHVLRKGQ